MNYLNTMRRSDSVRNLKMAAEYRKMGFIDTAKKYLGYAKRDREYAAGSGWKLP